MSTGSSRIASLGRRGRKRLDARLKDGRKSRFRWLESEVLETRTLLATTPAPAAIGGLDNLTNLGSVTSATGGNANSPTIEIDPYDPQHLVAVWSVDEQTESPVPYTTSVVEAAVSTDGGSDWTLLGGVATPQLDPLTINSTPPEPYTQVTEPTLAFDANHDFYVSTLQSTSSSDGAIYLTGFNFSTLNNGVTRTFSKVVYQWVGGSDAANSPVVAVDAAPPSGTAEPDSFSNNVYVAWASTDVEPANTTPYTNTGFNSHRIEMVVGTPTFNGNTTTMSFSGVLTANTSGNFGPQSDEHPQVVINQNADGQITIGWDDSGTLATASPPEDALMANQVAAGDSVGFSGTTGAYQPATSANSVTTPVTTTFTDNVSIPASELASLDDLTVTLALTDQESVSDLNITLIAPDGTSQITLVNNQVNAAGTTNTSTGLPGGDAIGVYGFTTGSTGTPGTVVGTEFDDNATRNIFDATNANPPTNGNTATDFIGFFRPEFSSLKALIAQLEQEDAQTGLDFIDGQWTLAITNFTSLTQTGVANQGQVKEFSLQFSTGMTGGGPKTIADTQVIGAIGNTFSRTAPSTPNGVGPGLVLAIDNTLGANSPYEGRIYAAYVGYENNTNPNNTTNPTTNTDIFLSYLPAGASSWTGAGIVNDDASDADGYSGSSSDNPISNYTTGNTQFQPEIAVDQATGTVVVSWRDARNDPENARVATYLTTSINGGRTFSPQTYANPSQTAVNAITGATEILGPEADNEFDGQHVAGHDLRLRRPDGTGRLRWHRLSALGG